MNQQRFYLIDILRLSAIFAIILLHTYSAIFFVENDYTAFNGTFFKFMLEYARLIPFSGFSIVVITFFLYGFKSIQWLTFKSLFILVTAGMILLLCTQGDRAFEYLYLEWDIYHYLFVGLITIFFLAKNQHLVKWFTLFGIFIMLIPFWKYNFSFLPTSFQYIFIGICDEEGRGGWPLLPWIGLVWMSYGFGHCLRNYDKSNAMGAVELSGWLVALLLSTPLLGIYHDTPIGPQFSCFMFRQGALPFFSHILWIFFALRISLLLPVNRWLSKNPVVISISNLYWSKHFGISYFAHLFILALASRENIFFQTNRTAFDFLIVGVFVLTEIVTRLGFSLRHHFAFISRK